MIFKIAGLKEISLDKDTWGGKAICLSELIRHGFDVPNGFVISSDVYMLYKEKQLDIEELDQELSHWMQEYSFTGSNTIFRSSANIEGTESYASCGIFESHIFDERISFAENVKKVWDSVHTKYTTAYCSLIGLPLEKIKMAVIVQKIVKGTYTCVLQSFDLLNNEDRVVCEYAEGDINSVVDGTIDANTIYIYPNGNHTGDSRFLQIERETIIKIYNDCKMIEIIFGFPVEIEAQISNSEIRFLQIRKQI